ncbi:hypothetical protein [Burkholderia guangdongensis]|uniref:hypothetical protein n=1 Tax=Burkholderia guangdongensis TaxID=1792500 RepID=UPI0015C7EE5D|nr:hypothetical protein [Burkholderia guangdongensis]
MTNRDPIDVADGFEVRIVPDKSAYLILMLFVAGAPLMLSVIVLALSGGAEWGLVTGALSIEAFIFYYLKRHLILLGRGRVCVRKAFSEIEFPVSDVTHVRLEAGLKKYTDRFGPFYRLIFSVKDEDVVVNAKIFKIRDINSILNYFNKRVV